MPEISTRKRRTDASSACHHVTGSKTRFINEALLCLAQTFLDRLFHVDLASTSLAVLRVRPPTERTVALLNGPHRDCAVLLPVDLGSNHWALVVIDQHRRQV